LVPTKRLQKITQTNTHNTSVRRVGCVLQNTHIHSAVVATQWSPSTKGGPSSSAPVAAAPSPSGTTPSFSTSSLTTATPFACHLEAVWPCRHCEKSHGDAADVAAIIDPAVVPPFQFHVQRAQHPSHAKRLLPRDAREDVLDVHPLGQVLGAICDATRFELSRQHAEALRAHMNTQSSESYNAK